MEISVRCDEILHIDDNQAFFSYSLRYPLSFYSERCGREVMDYNEFCVIDRMRASAQTMMEEKASNVAVTVKALLSSSKGCVREPIDRTIDRTIIQVRRIYDKAPNIDTDSKAIVDEWRRFIEYVRNCREHFESLGLRLEGDINPAHIASLLSSPLEMEIMACTREKGSDRWIVPLVEELFGADISFEKRYVGNKKKNNKPRLRTYKISATQ